MMGGGRGVHDHVGHGGRVGRGGYGWDRAQVVGGSEECVRHGGRWWVRQSVWGKMVLG